MKTDVNYIKLAGDISFLSLIFFVLLSIFLILFLVYLHAPLDTYFAPVLTLFVCIIYPFYSKNINKGNSILVEITPNEIILIQNTKTRGCVKKKFKKTDIEKFEICLYVKNLNFEFILNKKLKFPEISPYCDFEIYIKTKSDNIKYKIPQSTYSFRDYDLIFKFMKMKEHIPNFSYRVDSELNFIKEEIKYFSKNNKKFPFIVKQFYIFKELPLICKLFFIFILSGLFMCLVLFCILL